MIELEVLFALWALLIAIAGRLEASCFYMFLINYVRCHFVTYIMVVATLRSPTYLVRSNTWINLFLVFLGYILVPETI